MGAVIDKAAACGQADLGPVGVDATTARAHHHAAGVILSPDLSPGIGEGRRRGGRGRTPPGGGPEEDGDDDGDGARTARRRLHRRRPAWLKAAALGRSRGGLTGKVHLSADKAFSSRTNRAYPR
ncbi:hypothetical protein ACQP1K_24230 [Sphaerimonospora sp. CA-214678]|uniref:hypothetical protein n=1 Tax=Sphaerimonospora sp. CA-214678 TaxID=3240029 RepID=UPI003D8DF796